MRRFLNPRRAILLLALALPACTDEVPTLADGDLFPGGRPITRDVTVPAEAFLEPLGQFTGYTGPQNAPFLLVSNQFGGALEAHSLARFTDFPGSVSVPVGGEARTDSVFTLGEGRLLAPLDTAASRLGGSTVLRLWTLAQPWDFGSVSWELAVDTAGVRIPWTEPGGTPGDLLAEVVLAPGSLPDTVSFALDSLAVRRIAGEEFPGVVITVDGAPGRVQLGSLTLRAAARPSLRPDTTVTVNVPGGPQTFVFTPEPPPATPASEWQAGGIRSARTLFRIRLPETVPGADGTPVSFGEVALNEVALQLDPLPVPNGFAPLGADTLVLRRVFEVELGARAPLGEVVGIVSIPAGAFGPGERPTVSADLTGLVGGEASADSAAVTLALLGRGGVQGFGLARFGSRPRLRIVYTLPTTAPSP